jgi:D-alanine-D-alanine ligase
MKPLKVAVIREEVGEHAPADVLDTVEMAESVAESLKRSGWTACEVLIGNDAQGCVDALTQTRADLAFNLVESYCGQASLACVAPALCRKAGVPFTGSDEGALAAAADKALTRRFMAAAGIPAPEGTSLAELRMGRFPGPGTYIVKSRFEDASLGLEDDCVVEAKSAAELLLVLESLAPRMAGDCVAERFVDGREFNLALLAGPHGNAEALPLAEMVFDPTLPGPAILGYAAKWHEGSEAYSASARSFDLSGEKRLVQEMTCIGLRCWDVFGLAGYARVDFRVSAAGGVFVIDVNPNPCIAPDSGFIAAARRAGLDHADVVRAIANDALRRAGRTEGGHA